jgi:pyruvate-ferredoxin/flavodoxin oxidoreductase
MHDRPSGVTDWIRGLFGGTHTETPRLTGEEALTTVRRAVMTTELLQCDALCHQDTEIGPADRTINAFGGVVSVTSSAGARSVLAALSGLALTGRRSAGFISTGNLSQIKDQLSEAVQRRLPLVLHASVDTTATGNHVAYHDLAATGAVLLFPRNGQDAIDLTLAARRIAERALTPVLVVMDGPETSRTVRQLRLPDLELLQSVIGDADDEITSPTPAQVLLFGEHRRRVPRWFDLDRPAAIGVPLYGSDANAAAAGRRAFFTDHLTSVVEDALATLAGLTGRPLAQLSRYQAEGAPHLLVAQGVAIETAEAVAAHLQTNEGMRIGVLGVTSLRPFPIEQLRSALANATVVTVLDRTAGMNGVVPPLAREIEAAIGGIKPKLISAVFGEIDPAAISAACRNMLQGDHAHSVVRLGVAARRGSQFPKREALLQRVRRDYPDLEQMVLPSTEALDLEPENSRTCAIYLRSAGCPENRLEKATRLSTESNTGEVSGCATEAGPGLWCLRVTTAASPALFPGGTAPVDVTALEGLESSLAVNPMVGTAVKGAVIVASRLPAADLWAGMLPLWRKEIRKRDLRLFCMAGDDQDVLTAAVSLLKGDTDTDILDEILWRELTDPGEPAAEPSLPLAVSRLEGTGTSYTNVARFWGEFAQPRQGGEDVTSVPDPYLALGAMPPSTSTFTDMTPRRDRAPQIDASKCSGCGICWTSCPDSSIGAVALSSESLLNTAADRADVASAEPPSEDAGKLRRVHRQLGARLDGMLAKTEGNGFAPGMLREAFEWLTQQMKIGDEELPGFTSAFDATFEQLCSLPLSVTDAFFREAHREKKGSGELLLLAVNPQACQACGICAAVCPEDAIMTAPQTPASVESMRESWHRWEGLPDTSGASIARISTHPEVGPLAAVLMSRHCLLSVSGGDGAEPGSGERLATRQVAAVIEYQMQRRQLGRLEMIDDLVGTLRDAIRNKMSEAVTVGELGHLDEALEQNTGRHTKLGDVLDRLEGLGERNDVDAGAVRRMVQVARALEQTRWQIAEGAQRVGRARYGVVVAGDSAAQWAACFPRNPFGVPVTVDLAGHGADVAIGVIEGVVSGHIAEMRLARHAALLLAARSDLPATERDLQTLTWCDLSSEEKALCPPVIVLGGPDGLGGAELSSLSRLLGNDLPVKVVLLADCSLPLAEADPVLLALAHRHSFVLSASIAHPGHLFAGISAALTFTGPALITIHAPSPGRHGFAPDATIERARLAVNARVHPLLQYDPALEGVFGRRITLAGNPELDQPFTAADWAAGESRFEAVSNDACQERWATLQEMSGVVTPFTAAVREQLEKELKQDHQSELSALTAEYEAKYAELKSNITATQATRLRERLMQLAGFGGSASKKSKEKNK